MAITEIIRGGVILLPRDYLGLSTDIKPTTDSKGQPLAAGSSFNATDTGVNYRFDGVAWWQASQLTKEMVWQPTLAITDTVAHFLPQIDISDASDFYILVNSTLNQDSSLSISALDGYGDHGMEVMDQSPGIAAQVKATVNQGRVTIYKSPSLKFGLSLNGFLKVCGCSDTRLCDRLHCKESIFKLYLTVLN